MNYTECCDYLRRLGNEVLTLKFGLETTQALLEHLGNPHQRYPAVLVAGTNGKGSVSRMLHAICSSAGRKTALYTSPHLVRLEERMRVDGTPIPPEAFADCFTQVVTAVQGARLPHHPTFFEMVTTTALLYFARAGAEIAILEVGMGGRLDSTNVVDPLLSVITPVSYDHQQFLGESLSAIAGEKAGIMRPAVPVISWQRFDEARRALQAQARRRGALWEEVEPEAVAIESASEGTYRFLFQERWYRLGVPGEIQCRNGALAVAAAHRLRAAGVPLETTAIERGLLRVRTPGVLAWKRGTPDLLLDGAHNPDAAANLAAFIDTHTRRPRHLVFGMLGDKALAPVVLQLRPHFDQVFLTPVRSPRSAPVSDLQRLWGEARLCSSSEEAWRSALPNAATVVVTGSLFLVGEILALQHELDPEFDCAAVLAP